MAHEDEFPAVISDDEFQRLMVNDHGHKPYKAGANGSDGSVTTHRKQLVKKSVLVMIQLPLIVIIGITLLRTAYPEGIKATKRVHLHSSIDVARLDIAAASIDMMVEDTVEAAEQSQFIDISPFYDLVDDALDRFGIRGVYMNLFESHKFVEALAEVAKTRKMRKFDVSVSRDDGSAQPIMEYSGIPNDRKFYHVKTICSGCKWWLDHYVGAITADKLLQEGSLLLDEVTMDRVYDAPSFMKEIQRIERLDDSDIMVFHAQHGFTWQYLARKKPLLDSYPLEEAEAFCGDLLYTREYINHVSNDMARECRHGFGHGVFYVLARQQMVSGHYTRNEYLGTIRTALCYIHVCVACVPR